MVLKIGKCFTRSNSWANALQDENNRGWANNIIYKEYVSLFSNDINLSISEYFARNNKNINMMLKMLLLFVFEKNKVYCLAYFTRNN